MIELKHRKKRGVVMEYVNAFLKPFFISLDESEKARLLNDLLGLKKVYERNQSSHFYSIKHIKNNSTVKKDNCQAVHFNYCNQAGDRLLIVQCQKRHFLKNHYDLSIYYNNRPVDPSMISGMIHSLWVPKVAYSFATANPA